MRHSRFKPLTSQKYGAAFCVVLPAVATFGLSAHAQDAGVPVADDGSILLDPLIVSARKREEGVFEAPLSVSRIGRDELERARVSDNNDITRRIPNTFFVDSGVRGFNRFSIRGIGDLGGGFAPDDNSVGFFINGVPVPPTAIDGPLLDVERVEVLRGPQSALFGRNTQAGAVSIITTDPDDPEISLSAEGGNLGQRKVVGIVGGPISDAASGRIAFQYAGREGDVPNDLGGDLRGFDAASALASFKATLGDSTDLSFFGRYEYDSEDVLLRTFSDDPDFPRVRLDVDPDQETENLQAGLTLTHDFGFAEFTSTTGFHYGDFRFFNDQTDGRLFGALTGLPPAAFDNPGIDFARQDNQEFRINQEVRLSGEASGIDWLVGGNVFYSDFDQDFFIDVQSPFPLQTGTFDSHIETMSYDVFGAIGVPLTERLTLDGELRYTHERETFDGGFNGAFTALGFPLPINNQQSDSADFDLITGRIAASFAVTDSVKAYASYARGAKAGGFSALDTDFANPAFTTVDQFEAAFTDSFEVGVRGTALDDKVRFAAALFFNETSDEQLAAFDFTTFTASIENADTRTYGGEIEISVEPIEGLELAAALGLLDTEITDAAAGTGALVGGKVPNAPDVTFRARADYAFAASDVGIGGGGQFRVGAEYQHVGERTADVGNTRPLDGFGIINLQAGYEVGNFKAFAFAENVAGETYIPTTFFFGNAPSGTPVFTGATSAPRKFGGGIKVRF